MRIFIGWDSREQIAFHVLTQSILKHTSIPVAFIPLVQSTLRAAGLYRRPRGFNESTEFSLTRFLVPYLAGYAGMAIFMDCDMLCQADIAGLLTTARQQPGKAVWVCQHEYTPKSGKKFLGQAQTAYPRKNWSSLMVFDCARCPRLTPDYVNTASGVDLHRFVWLPDEAIGALPLTYNWLVGEYPENKNAQFLHYTLGGPWFPEYREGIQAEAWLNAYQDGFTRFHSGVRELCV